tara:strand:- start:68 stop:628 length:561 start_codon:yes stop_codon:yes gene_type:complete
MDLHKFGIKLFFKPNGNYPSKDFIPVFHNWIQNESIQDHILIDVVDYSHIPDGPGIMLIAHEGHFSLDKENNQPGILYHRKTKIDGDFQQRFETVFKTTIQTAQLLQKNMNGEIVNFQPQSFRFISNDRLVADNNEENQQKMSHTFNDILTRIYPDRKWLIEDFSQRSERLAFTINFQDEIGSIIN